METSMFSKKPLTIPSKADALPGRAEHMPVPDAHFVNGNRIAPPFPDGLARAIFGMGCFWGAERKFWQLRGVYSTAVGYADLLKVFWESHDPTQGMRQGNDAGTQYRSGIYYADDDQRRAAERSRDVYQQQLKAAGYGSITTEIGPAPEFYYAEDYHQQYLAKNPAGYCGLGGTGVSCPTGVAVER